MYNTLSYPLMTRGCPRIFGMTTPLQWDFQAMLITIYEEAAKQLYFISYCYCACSYTTRVVWKTKCNLMTCISCVVCVCFPMCARQNCLQQCVHTPVFKVLHALNVQAHACTCTRV